MKQTTTDILIIGSGPTGATYARMINDALPDVKIMMIELGPKATNKAGIHVKNIADEKEREQAQIASQGPHKKPYPLITVSERAQAVNKGELSIDLLGRPGTHLVIEKGEDLNNNEMPAAACSTNVGGMAAHWTCACPRPGNEERIPFIPADEYEHLFSKAEELLSVTQQAFPESPEGLAIQKVLGSIFNEKLSKDRQVQPMPLACKVNEKGEQYWVGPDVILGDLAAPGYTGNFELRTETICRQLLISDAGFEISDEEQNRNQTSQIQHHISGALIEHLPTKTKEEIKAKVVIVACDALRTPQLLWTSGIRPKALGHYLNEHPFVFTFVELKKDLVQDVGYQISDFADDSNPTSDIRHPKSYDPTSRTEPTIGVFWVPFDAPGHPFHGQIMHMDVSPLKIETHGNSKHIVGLGWGCLKEVRYEDYIQFSDEEKDFFGMPKMNIKFGFTEQDKAAIESAKVEQAKAAAFGKVIKEGEQTVMPPGTSLHYEGTTRMGEKNDGTSVCDSYSKVWEYDNLYVAGNGVIPMATTSNPTLTSVAMAVRGAEKIVSLLKQEAFTTPVEAPVYSSQ